MKQSTITLDELMKLMITRKEDGRSPKNSHTGDNRGKPKVLNDRKLRRNRYVAPDYETDELDDDF
jgi:hypothetical protein